MSDWQVGDLAVCVDDGRCSGCGDHFFDPQTIYRVIGVFADTALWLEIDGVRHHSRRGYWSAISFRKIYPDKREACETKFVTLLKRSKRKVPA